LFVLSLIVLLIISSILVVPDRYRAYDILAVKKTSEQLDVEKKNSLDALFVGDSLVYTSVSPLQLYHEYGFTSYNCGTQGQRMCDSYALIKNAFDNQNYKVVVLDVTSITRLGGIYEDNDSSLTLLNNIFPVFHYHLVYKLLKSPGQIVSGEDDLKNTYGYKYKGYSAKRGVKPYRGRKDYMSNRTENDNPTSTAINYLKKISDLCKEHNVPLLLVNLPSPKNWNGACHEHMQKIADENGYNYIDFNEYSDEIGLDWNKDTFDKGDHLNFEGSVKVSNYLGKYLKEHYDLADHRQDQNYSEWDELYTNSHLYDKKSV